MKLYVIFFKLFYVRVGVLGVLLDTFDSGMLNKSVSVEKRKKSNAGV